MNIIVYFSWKINCLEQKQTEHFTTADDAAITRKIKQIYLADVEAIRLLSNFAIQLSQGGFTVPGNMTFGGSATFSGSTTFTGGIKGDTTFSDSAIFNNNIVVHGKPDIKNETRGNVYIVGNSDEGSSLSITNSKKPAGDNIATEWKIYNMTGGYGNKLCFWRYGNGPKVPNIGPALELFDDGRVVINGSLTVTGDIMVHGGTNLYSDVAVHNSKTLNVSGGLGVTGGLNVTGNTTLTGNVTTSNNLNVTGTMLAGRTCYKAVAGDECMHGDAFGQGGWWNNGKTVTFAPRQKL